MRPARRTALLGLAFALVAALVDAEPLWVPAAMLVTLAAGGAAWVASSARGLVVERALGAGRVVEGEGLAIAIEVRARARVPLPPARIVDPLLAAPVALPAGARGGRLRAVRIEARFARRGRRVLGAAAVVVADPLGLASRTIRAAPSAAADELLVLPRIEPVVPGPGTGWPGARRPRRGIRVPAAPALELDGIRPLREGTPAARIFWPALARGAEPHERAFAAAGERRPVVVLDPRGAAGEDALDAAVRAAGSLARALAAGGGCAVLLPGERRPLELGETLAGWPQLHARLALVGGARAPSLAAVAGRRGALVLVSARIRADLPRALAAGTDAARVLVVPGELPGRTALLRVAGCCGYEIGAARGRPAAGRVA